MEENRQWRGNDQSIDTVCRGMQSSAIQEVCRTVATESGEGQQGTKADAAFRSAGIGGDAASSCQTGRGESSNQDASAINIATGVSDANFVGAGLSSNETAVEKVSLRKNHDGMATIEVVLILVVLIALVLIFKEEITELIDTILETVSSSAGEV